MCGICGILNFDGSPVNKDHLLEMNNAMQLRGPDDNGHYIEENFGMAMRRLSIIDISGGHQPITNEDNTIQVILNGEIYNIYFSLINCNCNHSVSNTKFDYPHKNKG